MITARIASSKNDEYYTPEYAIEPILKYLKPNSLIWCPFDTSDSLYVKVFQSNGHIVKHTHISTGEDFFDIDIKADYIISNPPYSLKTQILERLFRLNIPFAMLMGAVGIFESQPRFNMFKNNNFEIMYFNKRVSYFQDYKDQKPCASYNPPYSSVYICRNILPERIVFETIIKTKQPTYQV